MQRAATETDREREPAAGGASSGGHAVWLDETARIASFHQVDGYRMQTFQVHAFFMKYLHSLQERGYRFQ